MPDFFYFYTKFADFVSLNLGNFSNMWWRYNFFLSYLSLLFFFASLSNTLWISFLSLIVHFKQYFSERVNPYTIRLWCKNYGMQRHNNGYSLSQPRLSNSNGLSTKVSALISQPYGFTLYSLMLYCCFRKWYFALIFVRTLPNSILHLLTT